MPPGTGTGTGLKSESELLLGKVVGSVWATVKNPRLEPYKLLLVKPHGWYNPAHETDLVVAIDMAHAGVGDDVIVAFGQPGRMHAGDRNLCIEAAITGVVDALDWSQTGGEQ